MKRQDHRLNEPPFLPVYTACTLARKTNEGEINSFLTAGFVQQDAQHHGHI
jgi:hypothetical protein